MCIRDRVKSQQKQKLITGTTVPWTPEVAFVNEFKNIDWDQLLSLDNSDPDISFECFFSKLDNLIKKHIPLKKVSKKQHKSKPSKNPSNKKTKL